MSEIKIGDRVRVKEDCICGWISGKQGEVVCGPSSCVAGGIFMGVDFEEEISGGHDCTLHANQRSVREVKYGHGYYVMAKHLELICKVCGQPSKRPMCPSCETSTNEAVNAQGEDYMPVSKQD